MLNDLVGPWGDSDGQFWEPEGEGCRPPHHVMRRIRGFTSVELIIVVAILSVFAAVAIPALLPSIQEYRTRSATEQVAAELRNIQGLALRSGTRHRLFLRDCPSGPNPCKQYRIEREVAGPAWPPATDTQDNNSAILTQWTDLQVDYSRVRITGITDGGGTSITNIIYDSRGAGGNTGVSYPFTVTVASTAGPQRTISVRRSGGVLLQ